MTVSVITSHDPVFAKYGVIRLRRASQDSKSAWMPAQPLWKVPRFGRYRALRLCVWGTPAFDAGPVTPTRNATRSIEGCVRFVRVRAPLRILTHKSDRRQARSRVPPCQACSADHSYVMFRRCATTRWPRIVGQVPWDYPVGTHGTDVTSFPGRFAPIFRSAAFEVGLLCAPGRGSMSLLAARAHSWG
jgi:hypothetical protein